MGFLILVRRHLYIESGPWSLPQAVFVGTKGTEVHGVDVLGRDLVLVFSPGAGFTAAGVACSVGIEVPVDDGGWGGVKAADLELAHNAVVEDVEGKEVCVLEPGSLLLVAGVSGRWLEAPEVVEGWDVRLSGCVAGVAGDGRGDGRGLRCRGFHRSFDIFRGWGRGGAGLTEAGVSAMALHIAEVAVVPRHRLALGSWIDAHKVDLWLPLQTAHTGVLVQPLVAWPNCWHVWHCFPALAVRDLLSVLGEADGLRSPCFRFRHLAGTGVQGVLSSSAGAGPAALDLVLTSLLFPWRIFWCRGLWGRPVFPWSCAFAFAFAFAFIFAFALGLGLDLVGGRPGKHHHGYSAAARLQLFPAQLGLAPWDDPCQDGTVVAGECWWHYRGLARPEVKREVSK